MKYILDQFCFRFRGKYCPALRSISLGDEEISRQIKAFGKTFCEPAISQLQ